VRCLAIVAALILCAATARAETPWERYLAEPTPQHASKVQAITGRLGSEDLQILQDQVLAQDKEAFRLALRLYHAQPPGGTAEDLGVLLARTIRPHPSFFLQQLAATGTPCSAMSWVLRAPGLEYVDRPAARRYEIAMRVKALQSVKEKRLRRHRDDCVRVLTASP